MQQAEYKSTWEQLLEEKMLLMDRRTQLETELSEISTQIAHLGEVLSHLAPLAGVVEGDDFSGLGITDAIRHILKESDDEIAPTDIRKSLAEKGFDFSGHTAPMASVYKVLSRLSEAGEIERHKEDGGRVLYCWKRATVSFPDYGDTGITDDDIPF